MNNREEFVEEIFIETLNVMEKVIGDDNDAETVAIIYPIVKRIVIYENDYLRSVIECMNYYYILKLCVREWHLTFIDLCQDIEYLMQIYVRMLRENTLSKTVRLVISEEILGISACTKLKCFSKVQEEYVIKMIHEYDLASDQLNMLLAKRRG